MDCHKCGACCTEISISSTIPGHPNGKPAGVTCNWMNKISNLCELFNSSKRPAVCSSFQANMDICGTNKQEAVQLIRWFEKETNPIKE